MIHTMWGQHIQFRALFNRILLCFKYLFVYSKMARINLPDRVTLPDLCLLIIFDHLPLADLLRINLVCRRFAWLRSAAICRRRSLILFKDESDIAYMSHIQFRQNTLVRMALSLKNISQEACLNLSCYFINLTDLQIHNSSITPLMVQNVAQLIAAMKKLTTLKLFFTIENDQVGEDELTAT